MTDDDAIREFERLLADREPLNDQGSWAWFIRENQHAEGAIHPNSDLPKAIFDRLGLPRGSHYAGFSTRQAALDALSAACIALGRSLAFPAPVEAELSQV